MPRTWIDRIKDVKEDVVIIGGCKDANGNAVLTREVRGWYVRVGNVSFHYDKDKPPEFKTGDIVKFTMEKVS